MQLSYEHEIDLGRVTGLEGPFCADLSRTVISPEERNTCVVVGNTDSYRVYLNGARIGEQGESAYWTPLSAAHPAKLRKGPDNLLVELVKRSDGFRLTLGIRSDAGPFPAYGFNACDSCVDLTDKVC